MQIFFGKNLIKKYSIFFFLVAKIVIYKIRIEVVIFIIYIVENPNNH